MNLRKTRVILGLTTGAVFLYLAIRHANATDVFRVLKTSNTGWLCVAVVVYWLELGARVIRWRALLLHTGGEVPFRTAASAFVIGYAANNVLPAKLGELVRVDLISRLADVPRMASLGTVVVERIFDIVFILLMAGISLGFLVLPDTFDLARLRGGMIVFGSVCAVLMVVLVWLGRNGIGSTWRLSPAMHIRLGNLVRGIRILNVPEQCGRLLLLSMAIWGLNALAMWLIIYALGATLSPLQTLLLIGIVGLAAVLPAPPAGLGVLQYAFTLVFELLKEPATIGLVASLAVQTALLGSVTVAGAILFCSIVIPPPTEPRAVDG